MKFRSRNGKGFQLVTPEELARESIDFEVAFRRDPAGLCLAVGAALNEILRGDPMMNGWQWGIDWSNLPGAISVSVSGTANATAEWDCPAFFAATSVATYEEVDDAAKRLAERIRRALEGWRR